MANKAMTFDKYRVFETELAGRPLVVETGKMTQLANGACLVRYGETVVHVAATASAKPRDGIDFFPLSVDYEEKLYAVGRIPGRSICQTRWYLLAPSMIAASCSSGLILERAAR